MVKIGVIKRLLNNLENHIDELRSATDITYDLFLKDIRLQRFVERTLQISIECCFDIVHHIIADEGLREPVSYADAFGVLAENGILSHESVNTYKMMAQFRNKVVHYYEKIDPDQVYAIFKGKLDTFEEFKAQIENWITSAKE